MALSQRNMYIFPGSLLWRKKSALLCYFFSKINLSYSGTASEKKVCPPLVLLQRNKSCLPHSALSLDLEAAGAHQT